MQGLLVCEVSKLKDEQLGFEAFGLGFERCTAENFEAWKYVVEQHTCSCPQFLVNYIASMFQSI